MKIKLYPKGYDPEKIKLPTVAMIRQGKIWDKFEVQRILKLEQRAKIVDVVEPPLNMWFEIIK